MAHFTIQTAFNNTNDEQRREGMTGGRGACLCLACRTVVGPLTTHVQCTSQEGGAFSNQSDIRWPMLLLLIAICDSIVFDLPYLPHPSRIQATFDPLELLYVYPSRLFFVIPTVKRLSVASLHFHERVILPRRKLGPHKHYCRHVRLKHVIVLLEFPGSFLTYLEVKVPTPT